MPPINARTIIIFPAINSTEIHSEALYLGLRLKKPIVFSADSTSASFEMRMAFGIPVDPEVWQVINGTSVSSSSIKEFIVLFCSSE